MEEREAQDIEDEMVNLGKEAEKFVHSKLGRAMINLADNIVEENVALLISCEPTDIPLNTQYRNKIANAHLFKEMLLELVENGLAASQQPV